MSRDYQQPKERRWEAGGRQSQASRQRGMRRRLLRAPEDGERKWRHCRGISRGGGAGEGKESTILERCRTATGKGETRGESDCMTYSSGTNDAKGGSEKAAGTRKIFCGAARQRERRSVERGGTEGQRLRCKQAW